MRVACASLRDGKRVDSQGSKIRAHLGDGPDESGLPGHGGGPALDAGRSRITVKVSSSGPEEVGLRREETGRKILWPASGPTRSQAGMKLPCSKNNSPGLWVYPTAKGSGTRCKLGGRRNPKTAEVKKQSPTSRRAGAGL